MKNPYTFCFLSLTALILAFPGQCLEFALTGLNLWFLKMIPALLPFMILSGMMIRMNLTESFVKLLTPALGPLLRLSPNGIYAVIVGFLCGFPMGARVTADLYSEGRINRKEATYLLSFCNNIGPVYFVSFVLPTLKLTGTLPYLFGMYGLPLLYGIVLRRTVYRDIEYHPVHSRHNRINKTAATVLRMAENPPSAASLPDSMDDAIAAGLESITKLGGYMILFNLLNIVPAVFCRNKTVLGILGCLLEITGGIGRLGDSAPLAALLILPFGGLSCLAQTYGMIRETDLSIRSYLLHKLSLTLLTALFYGGLWLAFPSSFLV